MPTRSPGQTTLPNPKTGLMQNGSRKTGETQLLNTKAYGGARSNQEDWNRGLRKEQE
jgi:hypothetical protein